MSEEEPSPAGQDEQKKSSLWGGIGTVLNAAAALVTVLEFPQVRRAVLIIPAALVILLPLGLTYIKKIREWPHWNWVLATACSVLLLVVLALAVIHVHNGKPEAAGSAPDASSSSAPPSSGVQPPSASPQAPSPIAGSQPGIRKQAVLILDNQGTAYDLDSLASDWDPRPSGTHWTFQNIEYYPGTGGGLAISDEPVTDVIMTGNGPWTYEDCVDAPYNADDSASNPNNISVSDLIPGRGICVHTRNDPVNNPGKTDGGHYVLLVVQPPNPSYPNDLIVKVTVWN
jgi:hypothetical protein